MKTYEEKTQRVFRKIEEAEAIRKKRSRAVKRTAAPILSFCLVAVIGFGAWQSGIFRNPTKDLNVSDGQKPTINLNASDGVDAEKIQDTQATAGDEQIITGETIKDSDIDTADSIAYFCWNNLCISGSLKYAIDDDPGAAFSVLATYRPATANITDFTYEGKALGEWAIAADDERILPEKMTQLLKCGDELKYGTALYETGTPDGIKWDRSLYENMVAYFGDLLNKYIVDGEFLREPLENDIAALQNINMTDTFGETSARKQYALAWNAYLETVLPAAVSRLTENGIQCTRVDYRNDALSITVTAEQLKNLPLYDSESWYFSLNSGEPEDLSDTVPTEATCSQTVN